METNTTDKGSGLAGGGGSLSRGEDASSQGVFLPVAILMVAVLLILGWELYLTRAQAVIWQKQVSQREQVVNQARAVQSDLQKIAFDLISLSVTDPDARAIVDRYQIRQDANATPQAAARPAGK